MNRTCYNITGQGTTTADMQLKYANCPLAERVGNNKAGLPLRHGSKERRNT